MSRALSHRGFHTASWPVLQQGSLSSLVSRLRDSVGAHRFEDQRLLWSSLLFSKPPKGFEKFHDTHKVGGDAKENKEGGDKPPSGPHGGMSMQTLILGGLGLLYLFSLTGGGISLSNEITFQEFLTDFLARGWVEKVEVVNRSFARVTVRNDSPKAGHRYWFEIASPESFEYRMEAAQASLGIPQSDFIPVKYTSEVSLVDELRMYLPTIILMGVILLVFSRSMSSIQGLGGGNNIMKMRQAFPAGTKDLKSKVKFTDVAGLTEAKAEVMEFVDFLKDPQKYENLGAKCPKGALLVGPPGTGKTLLAKAVAGEASVPFYSMSGSDFVEVFVGVGPSRVRDLFQQARKHAPSIIFIDEIDAVGRKRNRGGFAGGNDERENTLNQMLVEMDGFKSSTGVVVLAGTNRADILDNALTRPGRFDRSITIDKPDLEGREEIFGVHLRPLKLASELTSEEVAKRMSSLTPGMSGADIANICNEAAIFAARRKSESVAIVDFERAVERVIGGLPKSKSLMSQEEKNVVSYHEAGHALVGWFLEHADPLLKVSIVPRTSGALGFAQYLPDEIALHSKEAVLDKIAVTLGGRASEELFIKRISTGASDDLDKVTRMANALVTVYGMDDTVGLVSYQNRGDDEGRFYKPYSEAQAQQIDKRVKEIIDSQYARVKNLLTEKTEDLHRLAKLLFEKETIGYHDMVSCVGERPFAVKKNISDFVLASGRGDRGAADISGKEEAKEEEEAEGGEGESGGGMTPGVATS
uniref:AAA+ ATPase domain-containing protein n=1 Tax=Chromera velia CCMP2878 TaxID=1169474 RepID=A0A0G4GVI2_9ALVE|eukprot:Cvel_23545.t1-p1 / transcript=Cvel_23545.t1 / gene=Cvel_23545 / organism=Chromera_velia_CCMP2878 / gene_product=AFG3-like protein 2, putative / transcript_product=AFG3-like protein 2, putative / location=Cvel_scaffold2438:6099-9741(-) / protein_length=753 / sequence_SO=supercontig / SO=protein_coding / is_pseudo=false